MIGALSFIYLLHELSIFFRAAEDLMSQIQKNYQKPQEELKKMKEAAVYMVDEENRMPWETMRGN